MGNRYIRASDKASMAIIVDDIKLTPRQERFAEAYVRLGYATEAYRECYDISGMNYESMKRCAFEQAHNPNVLKRIEELRQLRRHEVDEASRRTKEDLLSFCMSVLNADPNELINTRVGCCRYCHGEGHLYQWREREYMERLETAEQSKGKSPMPNIAGGFGFDHTLPPHLDCPDCRGEGVPRVVPMDTTKLSRSARLLLRGVKQTGRGGYEVLMADKEKYFEFACRILGLFDDKLRLDAGAVETVKKLVLTTTDPRQAMAEYEKMIASGPK